MKPRTMGESVTILKDTLVYTILPHFPKLLGILLLPWLMKYLSVEDFGYYGILLAYSAILSFMKDLGLYNAFFVSYFRYGKKYHIVWNKMFGLLSLWAFIYGGMVLIVVFVVQNNWEISSFRKSASALLLSIPLVFFDTTIMLSTIKLRLEKKVLKTAVIFGIAGMLNVLGNVLFIIVLKLGYLGFIISLFCSTFVTFLVLLITVVLKSEIRPNFRLRSRQVKSWLKTSIPFIPHNYSSYLISSSDRAIMNINGINIEVLGKYNFAHTVANYLRPLDEAIGFVLFPYYIDNRSNGNHESNKKLILGTHYVLYFVTCLIALWSTQLFGIITDDTNLLDSTRYFIWIILAFNYKPFYMATAWPLLHEERSNELLRISLVGGLLSVISNLIVVPFLGASGSAIVLYGAFMYLGFSVLLFPRSAEFKLNYLGYFLFLSISSILIFLAAESTGLTIILSAAIFIYTIIGIKKLNK